MKPLIHKAVQNILSTISVLRSFQTCYLTSAKVYNPTRNICSSPRPYPQASLHLLLFLTSIMAHFNIPHSNAALSLSLTLLAYWAYSIACARTAPLPVLSKGQMQEMRFPSLSPCSLPGYAQRSKRSPWSKNRSVSRPSLSIAPMASLPSTTPCVSLTSIRRWNNLPAGTKVKFSVVVIMTFCVLKTAMASLSSHKTHSSFRHLPGKPSSIVKYALLLVMGSSSTSQLLPLASIHRVVSQ